MSRQMCGWTGCQVVTTQRMTLLTEDGRVIRKRLICNGHVTYEFPVLPGTQLIIERPRA